MKVGLQIPNFTWPNGPAALGGELAATARTADRAGFEYVAVMDHFFQIRGVGPSENDMLEAYTALGFLAAHTERAKLLTVVTGIHYREPGLLAKAVTTLDVLSGGRAVLGIGAGWYEAESRGLGLPFPPLAERFERLEETLRIVRQMSSDTDEPYEGRHYRLGRTLNAPQANPPILIGGSGETKTLRLVAQYADMCNLFYGADVPHKLGVLRAHCERMGRPYEEIEKTLHMRIPDGQSVEESVQRCGELAGQGIDHVIVAVPDAADDRWLAHLAELAPKIAGITPQGR